MTWYMKGQSDYDSANFHMGLFFDTTGFASGDYNTIVMPDDVIEGDPFLTIAAETKPTWTPGSSVVELGLWDDYRIKIDSAGIWGWDEAGTQWVDLLAGGAGGDLNDLDDVVITGTPADNEVLGWDNGTSKWINQTAAELEIPLDSIANPSGDKEFNFANKHLHFKWIAPASGAHEGAFEIEASGAFSGDLVHIHQHTGVVGAGTYMAFIECEHANAHCLHLVHGGDIFDFGANGLLIGADARITEFDTSPLTNSDTKVPTNTTVIEYVATQVHEEVHNHNGTYEPANANIQSHVGSPGEDVHHPKTHDNDEHSTNYEAYNANIQSHVSNPSSIPSSHHTATVGGDLTHDSITLPNGNANEQHLTAAQVGALHAKQHAMDNTTYHTRGDNAVLDSSTSYHGFLKKLDNDNTHFMNGQGNWVVPGGGDADAIHDNVAGEIDAIAVKAAPTVVDLLLIEDVANSDNKKKISLGTIPLGGDCSGTLSNVAVSNDSHDHTHANTTGRTANDHHDEAHTHTHLSTTGRTTDDHHNQAHVIASHPDTLATGIQLTELTNSSETTLHSHTGIKYFSPNNINGDLGFVTSAELFSVARNDTDARVWAGFTVPETRSDWKIGYSGWYESTPYSDTIYGKLYVGQATDGQQQSINNKINGANLNFVMTNQNQLDFIESTEMSLNEGYLCRTMWQKQSADGGVNWFYIASIWLFHD